MTKKVNRPKGCSQCATQGKASFGMDIRMAFQPIVDTASGQIFAHEALVRGPNGEGAGMVFESVSEKNRYSFDQKCRVTAIESAARLGLTGAVSINFMPNAVYNPEACIQTTLWTADKCDFPLENLIFEFTEGEAISELTHLKDIFTEYRSHGFRTAIDDFGAGYSGLLRLADLRPDLLKLDMDLIRDIHQHPRRRKIVAAIVQLCEDLGIGLIAEGIEQVDELTCLQDMGINLIQGYLLAKPQLDCIVVAEEISVPRRAA